MPLFRNHGYFRITNPRGLPVRPSEYRELGTYSAEQFAPHSGSVITDRHALRPAGGSSADAPRAVLDGRARRPLGGISAAAGEAAAAEPAAPVMRQMRGAPGERPSLGSSPPWVGRARLPGSGERFPRQQRTQGETLAWLHEECFSCSEFHCSCFNSIVC